MKGRRRFSLLVALIAAAVPARALAEVPDFARSHEWIEVRTRNFTVTGDAGSRAGWDVAHKLERFALALGRLNPGLRPVSPLPTQVYVFRDQSELERYRPAQSENLVAFYSMTEDQNLLVVNGSPEGVSRGEVVLHEFVHCYLHGNLSALPTWLNEGLAVYYSTCRMTRTSAEFGKPDMFVANMAQGTQPMSLEMMFTMNTAAGAYRRDNSLRDQFYSQSYVLTHWLQSPASGRAARFEEFFALLHKGKAPQTAFRQVFPSSEWEGMVAALDAHRQRMEFDATRSVELPPPSAADDRGERALSAPEALTRLGELQLWLDEEHRAEAAEHFQAALALDPNHAPARVALGLTADLAGRAGEAEGHYAAALARAPGEARIWDVAARGTRQRLIQRLKTGAPAETLEAIGRLARERYRGSLRIAPDGLEALGGYGQTFAFLGEPADTLALRGLERAVEAFPGRADLWAALAVLRPLEGRTEEAQAEELRSEKVLDDFQNELSEILLLADPITGRYEDAKARLLVMRKRDDLDPEMLETIDLTIGRLDAAIRFKRAADLVKNDRLAEAETTLAGPGVKYPDEETRTRADRMLADVRGRRQIERALALVKAGKLAEARAAFAKVLTMDVPDPMKDYARARMKDLDAATKGR